MQNTILKMMTFNVRAAQKRDAFSWDSRKESCVQLIRNLSPDVVGLQETQKHMYKFLRDSLVPEYDAYGESRSPGSKTGESTPLFIKKERFQFHSTRSFMLSNQPDKPGSRLWYSFCKRICSYTTVVDAKTGRMIVRVFNTHLDHVSRFARKKGLKLILDTVDRENNKLRLPYIIMGDFNDKPSSAIFQLFKGDHAMSSCFDILPAQDRENLRTYHAFKRNIYGLPIDYLFASEGIEILNTHIFHDKLRNIPVSDHYPVIVDVSV